MKMRIQKPTIILSETSKVLLRWTTKIPPCRHSSEIQKKHHKRRNIDIPNTQIHDRSLSRFDTSTSITDGGVKLFSWIKM